MIVPLLLVVAMATLTTARNINQHKSVLTYNTLLYEGAAGPTSNVERRTAIVEAIRNLDADVICLQEVYIASDVEEITQGLSDVYGHSFSLLHQTGEIPTTPGTPIPAACPTIPFHKFLTCATAKKCINRNGEPVNPLVMVACLLEHCLVKFMALPQKCVGCFGYAGATPASLQHHANKSKQAGLPVLTTLVTAVPTGRKTRRPHSSSHSHNCRCMGAPAIGKTNINDPGLLLLSKYQMASPSFTDYHPGYIQTFRTGYLHANIDGLGDVTCTHLVADLPIYMEVHLTSQFTGYEEQNLDEVEKLLAFVTATDTPHIVLGDFNLGPNVTEYDIVPQFEAHYDALALQLCTTLLEACTYCHTNVYAAASGFTIDRIIDHVFTWKHAGLTVTRVMDAAVVPSTGLPLSDHYGILGDIRH